MVSRETQQLGNSYESLYIGYLQITDAYWKAELQARKFKEALTKIADEQLVCRASGTDTMEPALTVQAAQDLARKVLNDNP